MNRRNAIKLISHQINDEIIISANGFLSRDLFDLFEKPSNFYMLGSLGLASSIGLGISIKNPKKRIFIFDGDGNILMNLGSLTTIGSLKPKNLVHIIFDNASHESTGGQPTNSPKVKIKKIAQNTNYTVHETNNEKNFRNILQNIQKKPGPIMIIVKIKTKKISSERIIHKPLKIKSRFMNSI